MPDLDGNDSFWNELGGQRQQPAAAGGRLLAQHWRCPGCQKIIYAWDKTVPCGEHRVITDWQRYYQSEQFAADTAAAREQTEDSRTGFRRAHGLTLRTEEDLRAVAVRQAAEFRADPGYPGLPR